MENIPSSFMGYNKDAVNDIITEKDNKLKTQQNDINYLRGQIEELENRMNTKSKQPKNKKAKKSK